MRKISGNYYHKGKIVDFSFDIAANWEELTPMQTAYILQTLSFSKADIFTMKVSVMSLVVGPKNYHHISNLEEEDIYSLCTVCQWIFDTRPPAINKFPKINLKKHAHLAPIDSLSNLGFGEWCFAYEFYKLYGKTSDELYLNKLIATIYRPGIAGLTINDLEYKGDLRQPFNENLIDSRLKSLQAVQQNIKLSILTWFTSALLEVMDKRPHVFPEKNDLPEAENGEDDQRTWLTVFRELLGPKFGTSDQLKFTNAMFVLDYLEEQHIAYENAKKPLIT